MTRSGMADRSPCRLLAYFAAGEFRSRKRQAGSEAGKASQPMGYSWRQRLGQAARSPTWAIPVPRVPGHRSLAGVAVRRRGGPRGRLRWPRGRLRWLRRQHAPPPRRRIASSGGSNYEAHSSTALKLIGQASACSRSGRPTPNYGYLFKVSADRKRVVRCAHILIGGASDNPDGDAERLEKDPRKAVEEFLGLEREGK